MFNKILVGVDGSRAALEALDKAIKLQGLTGAEIYILCVFRHQSLYDDSLSAVAPDMQIPDESLTDFARGVVEHAKEFASNRGAKNVRGFVKGGRPSKVIVEFAKEHDIDLIVLGSHGSHSKDGIMLGSVTHRVTNMATCPTLVV